MDISIHCGKVASAMCSIARKLLIGLCLLCAMVPALAAARGYFGAWFGDLPASSAQTGVIVKKVYAGMAAEKAGLKEGEIVTRINGAPAPDPPTAVQLLAEIAAGEKVRLTVIDSAAGAPRTFDVLAVMGDRPTAEFAKLKKTYVRCPSPKVRFCNAPPKQRDRNIQFAGQTFGPLAAWCLFALVTISALAFLANKVRQIKKGVR